MSTLTLGIRLTSHTFERVKVNDIDLDGKVELLKEEASRLTNMAKNGIELIYSGNILEDESTLRQYGIKPGATIHVLKIKEKENPIPVRTMTESEILELVMAFKTFARHPGYRSALHRLSRQEVLENIMQTTPGLNDDVVGLAILRDPELLVHMENMDTCRRIAELHPALAEAAALIAAAVHEEAVGGQNQASLPPLSSGYSYSLDALSEDDEMDSSQSSDSQPRGSDLSRQQSYSVITSAQVAAAFASATGLVSSSSPPASSSSSSADFFTQAMFTQALQDAFANVGGSSSLMNANGGESEEQGPDVASLEGRLARQLQQMHELGLTDDAINLQALQATGGDVQAAIDLVFSGSLTFSPP